MLAEQVQQLLEDFGSLMTLVRPSAAGTYDPLTDTFTPGEPQEYDLLAVFVNYEDKNVDGSVVRMGDRRLLVSALGSTTAPQIDDKVQGLRVIDVRTIAPNGTPIAYSCQMRK